jgi:signal peptidase I
MKILATFLILILSIAYFGGLYRIFLKANEKGWKALIPVYNIIVLLKVLVKPRWFIVFIIVPVISNLVFLYILIQTYDRFGIRKFWKVLLAAIFSIVFIPLIGFSKKYSFETRPTQKYNFKQDIGIWGYALIVALVFVLFVKGLNVLWFQNYKIPTAAMEHSILIGDHVFVNNLTIGPRLPMTPLSLPFYQNTIPGTCLKSYVDWIKLPYIRLGGSPRIKRNDIIVFNFPEGDTVCTDKSLQSLSYYYLIRNEAARIKMLDQYASQPLKTDEEYYVMGRKSVWSKHEMIVRPIDRHDSYIKRCIAVPGDTLKIIASKVFINGKLQKYIPGLQFEFAVNTDGRRLNIKTLKNWEYEMRIFNTHLIFCRFL